MKAFPQIRVGIHGGPALERHGRYFGTPLNLATRVAAHARAGQILCTEHIAASLMGLDVDCRPLGAVRFRNVPEPVKLVEVVGKTGPDQAAGIDPVCRMQVRPETAPARLPYGDVTYHFCSFACARAFAERPERYLEE